jgi:hypothetical protein
VLKILTVFILLLLSLLASGESTRRRWSRRCTTALPPCGFASGSVSLGPSMRREPSHALCGHHADAAGVVGRRCCCCCCSFDRSILPTRPRCEAMHMSAPTITTKSEQLREEAGRGERGLYLGLRMREEVAGGGRKVHALTNGETAAKRGAQGKPTTARLSSSLVSERRRRRRYCRGAGKDRKRALSEMQKRKCSAGDCSSTEKMSARGGGTRRSGRVRHGGPPLSWEESERKQDDVGWHVQLRGPAIAWSWSHR